MAVKMTKNIPQNSCFCHDGPQLMDDNNTGEKFCKNCGVILESHTIGYSISNEKNTTQRHDYGIGTSPAKIKLSHRASEQISQNESSINRRTREIFQSISPMLQKISATTSINNDAYFLARKCITHNMSKGRTKIDVAAACVMISCKINGKIITEKELLSITNASKKSTRRIYRIIWEKFGIKPISIHERTIKLINRICSDLGISQKIMLQSLDLLDKLKQEEHFIGSHPGTIAGGIVYIMCDEKYSQRRIADISGVSAVSLQNFNKKYRKDLSVSEKKYS